MSVSRHELHLLTGAYAADALPPAEAAAFERHLRRCPSCADEVRGLREATARLAVATAVTPPPAMRDRVLAATARTRQATPPGHRRAGAGVRPAGRLPRVMADHPVLSAALTTLAAAVIALGLLAGVTQHQLQQTSARSQAIAVVLAAPDARLISAGTSVGGKVTAVVALHEHQVVITAHGMPSLPDAQVYQLWVMAPGRVRSAGLLVTGSASPVLAAGVRAGDRIGITVEPAGGTSQPTTVPIVVMPVSA